MDNILLDPESLSIKVIDFGFAIVSRDKLSVHCGTPSYMAPEVAAKRGYLGQPADVWALGVILYCMVNGGFPFRAGDEGDLFRKIQTQKPPPSREARSLLDRLLRKSPEKRPRAEEILEEAWLLNR
jgi:serine/threonine protein kinase